MKRSKRSVPTKFVVYRAKDGFRWRAKRAGRIVAEGGEAYVRREKAERSLTHFLDSVAAGEFDVAMKA